MATSRAWRVHLGFVRTSPAGASRRRVSKGDEFNKAAPALPAPAAPAPAAGENGARRADEPPTPPSGEGAKPGAAILRPAMALCRALRLLSQVAATVTSMSLSKSLCEQFEHSGAWNKQF